MRFRTNEILIVLASTLFVFSHARLKCGLTQGVSTQLQPPISHNLSTSIKSSTTRPARRRSSLGKGSFADFPDNTTEDPRTVLKRILPSWPDIVVKQDDFMVDEVKNAQTDVIPAPVNGNDINSGLFFEIGGSSPVSIGLGARETTDPSDGKTKPILLAGCTAIIVMSQKAVWFGHFWETLSYDGGQELFQKEVLDFLNDGGTDNPDVQQSLAAHAAEFRDQPSASAWVLWPAPDIINYDNGEMGYVDYNDETAQIQVEIWKLTGIEATSFMYATKPPDELKTAIGRALYQYDPQAQENDPKRGFRFIHERTNEGITYF